MHTAILLITHNNLGEVLTNLAKEIIRPLPTKVKALSVPFSCDTEKIYQLAKNYCEKSGGTAGTLILTDLYGSTPGNIATRLYKKDCRHIISGINLPMLLRALNYCGNDLTELTVKVAAGGRDGIKEYKP